MTYDTDEVDLTRTQLEMVNLLEEEPRSISELAAELGISENSVHSRIEHARGRGAVIQYDHTDNAYHVGEVPVSHEANGGAASASGSDGASDSEDSEPKSLTTREEYILAQLPASSDELAADLDISPGVVDAHVESIEEKGWPVHFDVDADAYYSPESHHVRSSEHKTTRTKKANKWWQLRHDELVREFRALDTPTATQSAVKGNQDFISHLTDLHMGDLIISDMEDEDGNKLETYNTELCAEIIDYITQKQLDIFELQSNLVSFDTWHELWGGDFLTNEGIYQGMHEDLDAFLDEQHDTIIEPLITRLKAISERVETVNVVAQIGNHGRNRADGTSRQANADLILYKTIRNTVAQIRKHGDGDAFENVHFTIGEATNYKNFPIRGGKLRGHLRHGHNASEHIGTSASKRDWRGWLINHDFDIAFFGHYHKSKRLEVMGRPVFMSGSPKPADDFAEQLAEGDTTRIATVLGMSDDGLTFVYPIDTRDYEPPYAGVAPFATHRVE